MFAFLIIDHSIFQDGGRVCFRRKPLTDSEDLIKDRIGKGRQLGQILIAAESKLTHLLLFYCPPQRRLLAQEQDNVPTSR